MKTRIVVAIAAASLIPLSGSPNASVLCTKKSGAVFLRSGESCGRKETRLSPTTLGLQAPAGPPGQDGEDADTSLLPIAFGVVGADGSLTSGTDNVEPTLRGDNRFDGRRFRHGRDRRQHRLPHDDDRGDEQRESRRHGIRRVWLPRR